MVNEDVLGHRTFIAQLRHSLADDPSVEAHFANVPPPNRLGRLLLRRWRRLGDADLHMLRWRLRWSWHVRRELKQYLGSVDVALINTQAVALLARRPMRRLPCVLLIDATVGQFTALEYGGPQDRWSPRQERILTWLERRAIKGAAGVVAMSEWNAEALRRECELYGTPLATIHPGIDADWWGEAAARRPARHEPPLRILFVGNNTERKGLGALTEAIGRLGGKAILDVVTGDDVEESESTRVHRGVEAQSERLRELYAAADVFALPTAADAVPWVVPEAMAAGLPVVASRVGAIEEMVGAAGETVEPGDVDELVTVLRRLSDPGLRRQLGQKALARVRERYDSALQMPRLVKFLAEAADASPTGPRMQRRTLVALGAGAAGVALVAPYAVLLADDEFEHLVAAKMGIEPQLAGELLKRARAAYGDVEYEARAAAFALAVRDPAATLLPDSVRKKTISGLIEPMFYAPAANLAYGVTGHDPGGAAPCAGLVRNR